MKLNNRREFCDQQTSVSVIYTLNVKWGGTNGRARYKNFYQIIPSPRATLRERARKKRAASTLNAFWCIKYTQSRTRKFYNLKKNSKMKTVSLLLCEKLWIPTLRTEQKKIIWQFYVPLRTDHVDCRLTHLNDFFSRYIFLLQSISVKMRKIDVWNLNWILLWTKSTFPENLWKTFKSTSLNLSSIF